MAAQTTGAPRAHFRSWATPIAAGTLRIVDATRSPFDPIPIVEVAGWLRAARSVVILTGAGISTESGIPDFRGPQGLWTTNPDAEKASDIRHYRSDPELRRRNWQARATNGMWDVEPNAGHRALVELAELVPVSLLVTQNVDGLHHAAGSDPDRLVEIHGTTHRVKCLRCSYRAPMEDALARVLAGEADPACPECGYILKSATVSFGESLDEADLERSFAAAESADVFLALGTSLGVYPIARMPALAHAAGARIVIINAQPTPFDDAAAAVARGALGEVLPTLVAAVHAG
ncbi:MAG: SIR2 family NAD-dependent protein deacylase [Actinomycetes bacterium]